MVQRLKGARKIKMRYALFETLLHETVSTFLMSQMIQSKSQGDNACFLSNFNLVFP